MAEIARNHVWHITFNGSCVVDEEKWANHYSSNHQLLLVGEGDFSFSLSLAMSFGSASNIVATSLDSYDEVINKYKQSRRNLQILHAFRAQLLHGVDSLKMKFHMDLRMRRFDRIVYNFPHAGFLGKEDDHLVITKHRNLVRGFLMNASGMLRPNGEIHVTHKTAHPFDTWNIEELASQSCLTLLECVDFNIKDYPGYNNKRGAGRNPDQPFPLGKCSTFKFIASPRAMKSIISHHRNPQQPQEIPLQIAHTNPSRTNECFWIFREYFDHERLTYGQADYYLHYSVPHMLRIGFERYKRENRDGYVNLLEELWNLSRQKVEFLRNWLFEIDQQY